MRVQRNCSIRMVVSAQLALAIMLAVFESGTASPATDADLDYYYKRMYDFGLGKRAYTYSANKRPQYDFGIGKRSPDSNRQKMYAFGLGKRYNINDNNNNNYEDYIDYEMHDDKRIKPYEFGLGKRAAPAPYSFGLGKRGGSSQGKLYSFGLGKRGYNNDFGISQRSQRYNFGIGKRDVSENIGDLLLSLDDDKNHNVYTRASQKYNFGLGKRSSYNDNDDAEIDDDNMYDYHQSVSDIAKRSRYNFGLGKRNIGPDDFSDIASYDGQHDLFPRASQKFNFGLGKREVSKEDLQQLEEDILPTLTSLSSSELTNTIEENNSNSVSEQHTSNTRKREITTKDITKQHQMSLNQH
ncbi:allatostatin A [Lycorma delicatula]|uniref:allatostatin A n=1 Tax=Lycorma delicatula TaxID=130591 RepID=UPI003F513A35